MKKRTLVLALFFLILTLGWLGVNIYWMGWRHGRVFDLVIPSLFVVVAFGMVWNEAKKKARKHLEEANKHQIP